MNTQDARHLNTNDQLNDDDLSDEALDQAMGQACYCWANQKGQTE